MSLLSPKNNKGKKQGNKNTKNNGQESKFIKTPSKATGFLKKQGMPGAKRGS
jgi:hypothetical protein